MSNVLITGCSSGFGAASARRFAEEGHTVFAGVRQLRDAPAATTGTTLDLINLVTGAAEPIGNVTEFVFDDSSDWIAYATGVADQSFRFVEVT